MSEVGSGQVAIFPTYRGFRRSVEREVDGTATSASRGFSRTMSQAGTTSGQGFSRAFASQSRNLGQDSLKALNASVARSASQLSAARLKEQDAAGKVRVAEAALAEARERGGAASARSIAAEERLATAQRGLSTAQASTARSSTSLRTAQAAVAEETARAGNEATRSGLRFRLFGRNVSASGSVGARGFNASMASIRGRVGGLAASIRGSFAGLGPLIAASLGGAAIGSYFKGAVQAASDLQQNIGGVEAVMKSGSKAFLGYSKTAATSVGISASEYNQLGTLIGSQLKNGGVATDQLASKTKSLISTGADLSAMFGGSAADAVDALSSALKGERDPIERYGVSLNQAKIDAEAASLGFKKVGGSLSTEANQAATLSLIMKQTADAHGAFGRENDTLAHKQQVLNAQWQDGKARLGTALLPAVTAVTGALSRGLGPALDIAEKGITGATKGIGNFVDGFRNGTDAVGANQSRLAAVGASFYAALQPIGAALKSAFGQAAQAFQPFIGPLKTALSALLPTFISLAGAVSPLGIVLKGLAPILPLLSSSLGLIATTLATALGSALTVVVPLITQLSTTLSGVLTAAIPILLPIIGQLVGTLADLIPTVLGVVQAILPLVTTLISQLAPVFLELVTSVLPPVVEILGLIVAAVGPLVTALASVLVPVIQALLPVVVAVFGALVPIISSALKIVLGVVKVVTGLLTGNWSQVWSGIKDIVSGAWGVIKGVVVGAINIVKSVIIAGIGIIRALWAAGWSAVAGAVSSAAGAIGGAVSGIVGAVRGKIGEVVGFFTGLPGKIVAGLSGLGSTLSGIGVNMIEGLIGGIKNKVGDVVGAITGVAKGAINSAKSLLGIHSPSTVFKALGRYTVQGFALGITGSTSQIKTAMTSLSNKVIDAFNTKVVTKTLVKKASKGQAAVYSTTISNLFSKAAELRVQKALKKANSRLTGLAKDRDGVAAKLKTATTKLNDAIKARSDFAASVSSSVVSGVDASAATSGRSFVQQITDQIKASEAFRKVLAKLKKAGLDNTSYAQLVAKGVDALPAAQSILSSGAGVIKNISKLQGQLGTAAKGLGKETAQTLYGAGVDAARGIVRGLQSQKSALVKTMSDIGTALVKSIKKNLGIHSPSTVFRDQVGRYIPAGVEAGIDRGQSALDSKIRDLVTVPKGMARSAAETRFATTATLGSATSPTTSKSDRPIYMDGSLFGIIRELANGEATLVLNTENSKTAKSLTTGLQRSR